MTALGDGGRAVFPAGTLIFAEGDEGCEAYMVESGRVAIFKTVKQARVDLGEIEPGGLFGEMALIDDQPRMASAIAITDTACVVIGKERLSEQLAHAPKGVQVIIGALLGNIRLMGAELAETRVVLAGDKPA